MSKNPVDTDALKLVLINLLEDEKMLNSIRGALCQVLGCAVGASVAQGEPRGEQGGEHESAQGGKEKCRKTEERLQEAEINLVDKNERIAAQEQEISQLNSSLEQAKQAESGARDELESVRRERARLQDENTQLMQRSLLSPELARVLAHVRSDKELAERFELKAAPSVDDLTLLVQTVSVLSQSSNLKALGEFYRTRCEDMSDKLDAEDMAVFKAALGWLNENWPKKPYEFFNPPIGTIHSADAHILANGNKSAAITSVWLPGVPELKLKPLVATV